MVSSGTDGAAYSVNFCDLCYYLVRDMFDVLLFLSFVTR